MLQGRKMSALLSDKRTLKIAVIIGIAAIVLIFMSTIFDMKPDKSYEQAQQYAEKTEERLLQIISHIDGVGEAEIFLTMDNSGENVYHDYSDKKTLSIEPKVRGVVIVCEGGNDPIVASHVLEAVTKSLNINSDKVCITK